MRRWGLIGCVIAVVAVLAVPVGAQGGMLAFTSSRCDEAAAWGGQAGCGPSIWVARDDGSQLRRLTGKEVPGEELDRNARVWDEWPSWSGDGQTVFFKRTVDFVQTLQARSLTGGSSRQIGPAVPNAQVPDYGEPAWSPDGRSVVFTSWTPGVNDQQGRDLYLVTADGSIRQLTHGPPHYQTPTFTRDGQRILAQSANNGGRIVSMDLRGGDVRPVFTSTTHWFEAPDGRKFSYLEYGLSPDGKTLVLNSDGIVYTTQLEGGILSARTSFLGLGAFQAGRLAYADEPGPRLITSSGNSAQHPLGSLDLASGGPRRVTLPCPCERRDPWPRQEYDSEPAWAPTTPRPQVDVTPPALELSVPPPVPVTASRRRTRTSYPAMRRGSLRLQTFDTSGVKGIEASVSRLEQTRKGMRCRFLESRGFSSGRRCGRPRYRPMASGLALQARLAALPAARYRLDVRALDVHGRRSRPKLLRFTLAPRKQAKRQR